MLRTGFVSLPVLYLELFVRCNVIHFCLILGEHHRTEIVRENFGHFGNSGASLVAVALNRPVGKHYIS